MAKIVNNKIKYFVYARRSSESEDRQMASIDSQINELKRMAQEDGLDVIASFVESKSAKAPGRKIFNEMISRIHKGEASGIICWKLNRLARNPIDGGQISWLLQQGLIQHIQTNGRSYYPTDNVIMMAVELGMANQFINDLRTDTKRGLKSKAERGWYPTFTTLGYMHNPLKKKGEKEILKDPERFDMVRQIFDLMLTGRYSPNAIYNIARKKWGLTTKAGRKIARSTIYRILNDPFYYGEFEYPKGSNNWYKGLHEPMITRDEYERIQKMLGRRDNPRPRGMEFACKGPLFCGECGAKITAEYKVKRQKNGNIHYYTYYHCTKRKDPECKQFSIKEPELLVEINKILSEIDLHPLFYQWAIEQLRDQKDEIFQSSKQIVKNNQLELEKTDEKIRNLINMRAGGELTEAEFLEQKRFLQLEKDRLGLVISKEGSKDQDWVNYPYDYLKLAEKVSEKFTLGDTDKRRSILNDLGSNLYLKDKTLNVIWSKPLDALKTVSEEVRALNDRFGPISPLNYNTIFANSQILLRG